jgi:hypothetical protein
MMRSTATRFALFQTYRCGTSSLRAAARAAADRLVGHHSAWVFGSLLPGLLGGGGAVDLEDLDASQVQPGSVT